MNGNPDSEKLWGRSGERQCGRLQKQGGGRSEEK